MTNGIVKTSTGYSVRDFESGKMQFDIGAPTFDSFVAAVEGCKGRFYPDSYYPYLMKSVELDKAPDADTWENMIYAGDPRGVWDGEQGVYRNVTEMDRGAATDEEIAYVDALTSTYESLMSMVAE